MTAHQTKQACDVERCAETRTGVGILSTCQQAEAKVGEGDSSGRISTQATAWSHFVDRYSAAIG